VQRRRFWLSSLIPMLGVVAACRSTPMTAPGPGAPLRLEFLHDFTPSAHRREGQRRAGAVLGWLRQSFLAAFARALPEVRSLWRDVRRAALNALAEGRSGGRAVARWPARVCDTHGARAPAGSAKAPGPLPTSPG
jgi:hypothetical protein